MRKLILSVLFVLTGIILAGCGHKDSNTFTVGMECMYPPYNWTTDQKSETAVLIDGSNSYCDGYDIKMAQTIATSLNKTLVVKAIEWDGLIPALKAHQIDAIIAGMSPTDERKKSISFSDAYYRAEQVIVVKNSGAFANATSIQGFTGARIAAQLGTLQDDLIPQLTGAVHATPLPDYPTLVTALKSNTIDGFIAELPVANQIISNNKTLSIVQFADSQGFTVDESQVTTAIGLRKEDTDLLNQINEVLGTISLDQRLQWMNDYSAKSGS